MSKARCYGISSKIWYGLTRLFRTGPSWRSIIDTRAHQPVVAAVGGNSFEGLEAPTARNIVSLFRHNRLIITHGNGPQVGKKLEEAEEKGVAKSIALCTRETQVEIGEALRSSIQKAADQKNLPDYLFRPVINPTRVLVDPKDPAFTNPTKYIGREFAWEKIKDKCQKTGEDLFAWEEEGTTWSMKAVPGKHGIFRRVVASPKPIQIQANDLKEIRHGLFLGKMVIAVGGGGVPTFPDGSRAEAVIDKDLATALLCRELRAQSLVISTGVTYVAHDFAQTRQKDILYYQLKHALRNLKRGQYPAGAMGEKIEAAINALRFGVNEVMITHPTAGWEDSEGTIITRGLDLSGRILNLARMLRLRSNDLQRWLVT